MVEPGDADQVAVQSENRISAVQLSLPQVLLEARRGTEEGKLLVVDDDESICAALKMIFGNRYTVFTARTGSEAKEVLTEERPHVVLLDIVLPDMDGLCLLAQIRKVNPEIKVIMLTASEDTEMVGRALHLGACDFVKKPIGAHELKVKIHSAIGSGAGGGSKDSLNTGKNGDKV